MKHLYNGKFPNHFKLLHEARWPPKSAFMTIGLCARVGSGWIGYHSRQTANIAWPMEGLSSSKNHTNKAESQSKVHITSISLVRSIETTPCCDSGNYHFGIYMTMPSCHYDLESVCISESNEYACFCLKFVFIVSRYMTIYHVVYQHFMTKKKKIAIWSLIRALISGTLLTAYIGVFNNFRCITIFWSQESCGIVPTLINPSHVVWLARCVNMSPAKQHISIINNEKVQAIHCAYITEFILDNNE